MPTVKFLIDRDYFRFIEEFDKKIMARLRSEEIWSDSPVRNLADDLARKILSAKPAEFSNKDLKNVLLEALELDKKINLKNKKIKKIEN